MLLLAIPRSGELSFVTTVLQRLTHFTKKFSSLVRPAV